MIKNRLFLKYISWSKYCTHPQFHSQFYLESINKRSYVTGMTTIMSIVFICNMLLLHICIWCVNAYILILSCIRIVDLHVEFWQVSSVLVTNTFITIGKYCYSLMQYWIWIFHISSYFQINQISALHDNIQQQYIFNE